MDQPKPRLDHILERFFAPAQIAQRLSLSEQTVIRLLQDQPGVLKVRKVLGKKRDYVTLRIPESALRRVIGGGSSRSKIQNSNGIVKELLMAFNPVSIVPLGRHHALVAQQPGNRSDRDIMFQQSYGERVSEPMMMNVNAGFAPYRIQSAAKAFDASFKIAVTRPAPEEVILAFNPHFKERVNRRLTQRECDIFASLEHPNYKCARLKVEACALEHGNIRNSKADIQQKGLSLEACFFHSGQTIHTPSE